MSTLPSCGKVWLVGAGPGDLGLVTLRAKECIEAADVVAYDYLVNKQVLAWMKPGAELLYVGKQAANHALPQEEINQLLIRKVLEGKVVTRLKGGDPYVFGRGGRKLRNSMRPDVPLRWCRASPPPSPVLLMREFP